MIIENNIIEMKNRLSQYKDKISGKTFLVTGGCGFIGKNIVWTLQKLNEELDKKCRIIVLDNYITGMKNQFDMDGYIDILSHDIVDKYQSNEKIDYIINLAGIASPIFANSCIELKEACGANLVLPIASAVLLLPPDFNSFGLGVKR